MTDSLAQRARTQGSPLIDGNIATFVWLGSQAPALAGDFTDWERGTPVQLKRAARGVWTYQLELPSGAYMEYAFFDGNERLPDLFNPRTTPNGIGDTNHYFYMPPGIPTPLAKPSRAAAHGVVTKHILQTRGLLAGRKRAVWLYHPPVDQPVPLIVIWDGKDYLRRARLQVIVDNLIAQRRIQPVALAMIDNGGPARTVEYACSEASLLFLLSAVLPLAKSQLNLFDITAQPGSFGVMGASMGGLMALFTALRLPHIFGKALCQSGAYAFEHFDTVAFDLVRHSDAKNVRIWMDAGLYDFKSLLAANRRMQDLLAKHNFTFEYREYPAGHNYPSWRDELWRGLEYLFPSIAIS